MNTSTRKQKKLDLNTGSFEALKPYEYQKYNAVLEKLKTMLSDDIFHLSEEKWQTAIAEIICLLYPKYISSVPKFSIRGDVKKRIVDFLFMDMNGNIDVMEIKKADGQRIMSKNPYRDNYAPIVGLSGAIMQIEKYIYYLNHVGIENEKRMVEELIIKIKN
jgi:hypothetical protein